MSFGALLAASEVTSSEFSCAALSLEGGGRDSRGEEMMTRTAECHSVRYLLLAWLLMLTAGQVVFLTLHFTAGEHGRVRPRIMALGCFD